MGGRCAGRRGAAAGFNSAIQRQPVVNTAIDTGQIHGRRGKTKPRHFPKRAGRDAPICGCLSLAHTAGRGDSLQDLRAAGHGQKGLHWALGRPSHSANSWFAFAKPRPNGNSGMDFALIPLVTGKSRRRSVAKALRSSIGILGLQTRAWLYESCCSRIKSLAEPSDVFARHHFLLKTSAVLLPLGLRLLRSRGASDLL